MSSVLSDLKKKASQLSEQERAELALSLIESLDGPSDSDVEQAWRKEIERRVAQVERGEVKLIPGEEVFARVRRRLGWSGIQDPRITKLLEKALEEVAKLPASEQDAVAAILLEELASEQRWAASFAKSQDKLAILAEETLAEYNAGRTKPL